MQDELSCHDQVRDPREGLGDSGEKWHIVVVSWSLPGHRHREEGPLSTTAQAGS